MENEYTARTESSACFRAFVLLAFCRSVYRDASVLFFKYFARKVKSYAGAFFLLDRFVFTAKKTFEYICDFIFRYARSFIFYFESYETEKFVYAYRDCAFAGAVFNSVVENIGDGLSGLFFVHIKSDIVEVFRYKFNVFCRSFVIHGVYGIYKKFGQRNLFLIQGYHFVFKS